MPTNRACGVGSVGHQASYPACIQVFHDAGTLERAVLGRPGTPHAFSSAMATGSPLLSAAPVYSHKLLGKRIAVADDNTDLRIVLSTVLCEAGAAVFEVSTGDQLLDLVDAAGRREGMLDAIVSDHWMPGATALDALARLSNAQVHVPFVVLTADLSDALARQLLKAGSVGVLQKPFDMDDLIALLKRACDTSDKAA